LRRLARVSNAGRDVDVQIAWLRARRAELSVRQRHGQDWLIGRLEKELRKERARFQVRLDKNMPRIRESLETVLHRARRVLADVLPLPPADDTPFGALLARVAREHARRIRDCLEAVRAPDDYRQAHRARVEGKRLRYVLEPVADLVDADEVLAQLKRRQDSLGELQDCQTLSTAIASALPDAARARGRRLAELVRDGGLSGEQLREEEQGDVEPGLIALARRTHTRAQHAFAEVERRCLGPNVDALVSAIDRVADELERGAPSVTVPPPTVARTDDVALR
jgi:CHAD domain-containing protein